MLRKLGQNIAKMRKSKKIPLERFAWDIDVARSYLYKIERGETNPTIKTLMKIAKGLGVSLNELLNY